MSTKTESRERAEGSNPSVAQVYHNFINGKWVKAKNGETFESYTSASSRPIARRISRSNPLRFSCSGAVKYSDTVR